MIANARSQFDATIEALRADALDAVDASGYFPAMYAQVTANVAAATMAGRFGDAGRMARFVDGFASLYLRPRRQESRAPACWSAAWSVSGDGNFLVVQHLLLGINAHVNHDLPSAVVTLAGDDEPASIRADFDAVNTVLAESFPGILRDLGRVAGWVNAGAFLGGGAVFNFSLRAARDQAWGAALRVWALDQDDRGRELAEIDELVTVLAYLITRPRVPVSWFIPVARRLEERDPLVVTKSLLGPLL